MQSSDDIFDEIKLDIGGNQIDNYDFCFQEFLEYYYKVYTKKTKIKDNKYLIEVPILFDVFVKSMLAIPAFHNVCLSVKVNAKYNYQNIYLKMFEYGKNIIFEDKYTMLNIIHNRNEVSYNNDTFIVQNYSRYLKNWIMISCKNNIVEHMKIECNNYIIFDYECEEVKNPYFMNHNFIGYNANYEKYKNKTIKQYNNVIFLSLFKYCDSTLIFTCKQAYNLAHKYRSSNDYFDDKIKYYNGVYFIPYGPIVKKCSYSEYGSRDINTKLYFKDKIDRDFKMKYLCNYQNQLVYQDGSVYLRYC